MAFWILFSQFRNRPGGRNRRHRGRGFVHALYAGLHTGGQPHRQGYGFDRGDVQRSGVYGSIYERGFGQSEDLHLLCGRIWCGSIWRRSRGHLRRPTPGRNRGRSCAACPGGHSLLPGRLFPGRWQENRVARGQEGGRIHQAAQVVTTLPRGIPEQSH